MAEDDLVPRPAPGRWGGQSAALLRLLTEAQAEFMSVPGADPGLMKTAHQGLSSSWPADPGQVTTEPAMPSSPQGGIIMK